jgi:hypothetical protein
VGGSWVSWHRRDSHGVARRWNPALQKPAKAPSNQTAIASAPMRLWNGVCPPFSLPLWWRLLFRVACVAPLESVCGEAGFDESAAGRALVGIMRCDGLDGSSRTWVEVLSLAWAVPGEQR